MNTEIHETKICTKCGKEKSFNEFSKGHHTMGKHHWCKTCTREYSRLHSKGVKDGRIIIVSGSMEDLRNKIINNSRPDLASGCWIWQGGQSTSGYGRTKWNGKSCASHRLSYLAFNGPFPEDLCVCHSCDVPTCVCPDHLWVGTSLDNVSDMIQKGRQNWSGGAVFGESNNHSNLKESHVIGILSMRFLCGYTLKKISQTIGTAVSNVENICKGVRWSHLSDIRMEIMSMAGRICLRLGEKSRREKNRLIITGH